MADHPSSHGDHDPEGLAPFVDDPADATDAVRAQVADCPECAVLVADLRLLAEATAALAVLVRPRDFRLSPDDAARLTQTASEPGAVSGRLGFDMTTPAPDHATHDPMLIAAHLGGTLAARDTVRVHDWLTGCTACATLRADLAALAVATRTLSTPPRPRDFSLTTADAERARPRGWRRALAAFASPRGTFTRPLAVGLTTLGLAGLVIANIPATSLFGGVTGAARSQAEMSMDFAAPAARAPVAGAAASSEADTAGELAPEATYGDRSVIANGGAPSGRDSAKGSALDESLGGDLAAGPSFLVLASTALLLTGLALALLRWGARRLGDG